ncbi:MAG: class I SAM-dependent methyltransferase [Hyphomicrobiales bacterium]|nr:class I SAM-dependent methyltransferase [Hyphomicrobiales bacterium]
MKQAVAWMQKPSSGDSVGEEPDQPVVIAEPEDLAQKVAAYWTGHNVTSHHEFTSSERSEQYFDWRNDQYFNYINLMPVTGHDGKVILDYGCGPGHDLVGFGLRSRPHKLIGMDVSSSSIAEAEKRLRLHSIDVELTRLAADAKTLPLANHSVDYIHCSGVLHHVLDPEQTLAEFRRILKPTGRLGIMVYNYDSLWLHLYVAYLTVIVNGRFGDLDIRSAFSKMTDGEECPIARVYRMSEFTEFASAGGFDTVSSGAAISMYEMTMFPRRFEAMMDPRLRVESRKFLQELTLDARGYPVYRGNYAGVDGCYLLSPSS